MSQPCRICSSRALDSVNADLTRGVSVRITAARHGFSRSGTDRHARKCLPRALAAYQVPHQTLADELKGLWLETQRLKAKAERAGDLRAALLCLRELADLLELKLKTLPPTLRAPQKEIEIRVTYEEPKTRSPLTDAALVKELGELCKRTRSEQVLAVAARLALLLKGRPIPQDLDDQLAKAEAGPPQLQGGDDGEPT